jgi:hypothetical protein
LEYSSLTKISLAGLVKTGEYHGLLDSHKG